MTSIELSRAASTWRISLKGNKRAPIPSRAIFNTHNGELDITLVSCCNRPPGGDDHDFYFSNHGLIHYIGSASSVNEPVATQYFATVLRSPSMPNGSYMI